MQRINQVVWSELAQQDFDLILTYLRNNWTSNVAIQFIDKVDDAVAQIRRHPRQFPLISKVLGIRKCVITKQNTLFFRIAKSWIEIIRLFDSRQDPLRLNFT
jgi:plasmid stabilization system protein ParE